MVPDVREAQGVFKVIFGGGAVLLEGRKTHEERAARGPERIGVFFAQEPEFEPGIKIHFPVPQFKPRAETLLGETVFFRWRGGEGSGVKLHGREAGGAG